MGYVTRARGVIAIEPPLRWAQIKDSPFLPGPADHLDVVLVLEEEATETDDGVQFVRRAVGVRQRYGSTNLYLSHFVTCPAAKQHRRKRAAS